MYLRYRTIRQATFREAKYIRHAICCLSWRTTREKSEWLDFRLTAVDGNLNDVDLGTGRQAKHERPI